MPRHESRGGGSPIYTKSPIYSYGVDTGNPKPPRGKHGSTSSIQHKLQADFEAPKFMDDRTPAMPSRSGANYSGPASGAGSGKTAYPAKKTSQAGHALDRATAQGIPNRNRFTQKSGVVGSGFGKRRMSKSRDI